MGPAATGRDGHHGRGAAPGGGRREPVRLAPVEETDGVEVVRSEERVTVGVVRVPTRRVRLVKRVVTERRVVELRREELHVVEEPLDGRDGTPGADGTGGAPLVEALPASAQPRADAPLELVLSEEEAEVEVRVVPRERVRVWVERVDGEEQVRTTVRREEVDVEVHRAAEPAG